MAPAECLEGMTLSNGWKVVKKLTPPPHSTGGNFSIGYRVKNTDGREAYLKALDFSSAFQSEDTPRALQAMTEAFNFERDLLEKCRNRRLDRVVLALDDGKTQIPGHNQLSGTVYYIVFEYAKGNVRDEVESFEAFDLAWCLRSLHFTAVGLQQLHSAGIAHQDLKPSNVLVFDDLKTKISDLGCASDSQLRSRRDRFLVPGDRGYAPIDQFYNKNARRFADRCLGDLYLLGSLFFFYFCRCSATHAIQVKLASYPGIQLTSDFNSDLPYIRQAFNDALEDLKTEINKYSEGISSEVIDIVTQLCEPDPTRRGDPRSSMSVVPRHSIERYVSRLNFLARKAELNLI